MRGLDCVVAFRLSLVETPAWRAPHHGGLQQDLPDGQITRLPVQPSLQKYSCFHLTRLKSISLAVRSPRGALAIVIDAGLDAVDAAALGA